MTEMLGTRFYEGKSKSNGNGSLPQSDAGKTNNTEHDISGSHGDEDVDVSLVGCNDV